MESENTGAGELASVILFGRNEFTFGDLFIRFVMPFFSWLRRALSWWSLVAVSTFFQPGWSQTQVEDDFVQRCNELLDFDNVPAHFTKYFQDAAESCQSYINADNRLHFYDCILSTVTTNHKNSAWSSCTEFLSQSVREWDQSVQQGLPSEEVRGASASPAKQLLSRTSEMRRNATVETRQVMESVKHLLRNLTCTPTVPSSLPIRQDSWVHKPDRTFSKLTSQMDQVMPAAVPMTQVFVCLLILLLCCV